MKAVNFHFNFLIILTILQILKTNNANKEYSEDEVNTSYNFYDKYNSPKYGNLTKAYPLNDVYLPNDQFPNEGSFLSNSYLFNKNLTDYKVHMAIVLGSPGVEFPEETMYGQFSQGISDSEDDLIDYFYQEKPSSRNGIEEKTDIAVNDIVKKFKKLYMQNLSLVTDTNTTQIIFIADNNPSHLTYTTKLINKFYENSNLDTLIIKDPVFTETSYNASTWNIEGNLPVAAYLTAEMSTTYFGYDIPILCKKFKNWLSHAAKDKKLISTYSTNFSKVHDVFVENYKSNDKFYSSSGKILLDLSEDNIRKNLTLGYILSNSLFADSVIYGIPNVKNFLPPEILEDFLKMHNFLKYEYYLYSDLHSNMIISPFIEFAMKEFNLKINSIKNSTANPENPRKIVWFTGYDNNISALFKLLNFDYRLKKNGILSLRETWENSQEELQNYLSYFPYVGYGYTVSMELLSVVDPIMNRRLYYIGFRDNFKDEYLFVLSLRSFNKLGKLVMMVPSLSKLERQNFCN